MRKEERIYNGGKTLFGKCREKGKAIGKRIKVDHFLIPYRKTNFKWVKDLNIRPETIRL